MASGGAAYVPNGIRGEPPSRFSKQRHASAPKAKRDANRTAGDSEPLATREACRCASRETVGDELPSRRECAVRFAGDPALREGCRLAARGGSRDGLLAASV